MSNVFVRDHDGKVFIVPDGDVEDHEGKLIQVQFTEGDQIPLVQVSCQIDENDLYYAEAACHTNDGYHHGDGYSESKERAIAFALRNLSDALLFKYKIFGG